MDQTQYIHRILIIMPVARMTNAFVAWWQANFEKDIDPRVSWPGLNTTGLNTDPITHRWCNGVFTDSEGKTLLLRLCQQAGLSLPDWDKMTRASKRTWLKGLRRQIKTSIGVWTDGGFNDSEDWPDIEEALITMGLKRVPGIF
jgi:hypothetical protein